jgi:hypothetical protein
MVMNILNKRENYQLICIWICLPYLHLYTWTKLACLCSREDEEYRDRQPRFSPRLPRIRRAPDVVNLTSQKKKEVKSYFRKMIDGVCDHEHIVFLSELDHLLRHHKRIRFCNGLLPGRLVIVRAAVLIAVSVQRTVQIPASALESSQTHALPTRSAPVGRRKTGRLRGGVKVQGSRRGRRRRRRGGKVDGGRDVFLIVMAGRLRRRDQHRRAFGDLKNRLLGERSGDGDSGSRLSGHGRHLRLHHGLTVTLRAKAHGGLAAEEATHVLAHHRALGSLGGCFLGHTLSGHLEEEPTQQPR